MQRLSLSVNILKRTNFPQSRFSTPHAAHHHRHAPCCAARNSVTAAAAGATAANSVPARLEGIPLDETLDGLQLIEQEYSVEGHAVRVVCPADPDAVLDRYIEAGTDGDPYWTRVWPSAIALAGEILRRPQLVAGMRVADLGAGLGVAGIAAALAGAREVVLLDREPLALACALMSARASGLDQVDSSLIDDDTPSSSSSSSSISIKGGGRVGSASFAAADADRRTNGSEASVSGAVRAARFDWSRPLQLPRFDVVLACDVLYESDAVEPIAAVVPRLLKSTSGLLLLADPPNRTAHNRERFLQLLREGAAHFSLDECYQQSCAVNQIDPELRGGVRGETVAVQFHALRRSLGNDTIGIKNL